MFNTSFNGITMNIKNHSEITVTHNGSTRCFSGGGLHKLIQTVKEHIKSIIGSKKYNVVIKFAPDFTKNERQRILSLLPIHINNKSSDATVYATYLLLPDKNKIFSNHKGKI